MKRARVSGVSVNFQRHVQRLFDVRNGALHIQHDAIGFDNLFSGEQAATAAAAYVVAPITYLLGNDYQKVDLESVEVTIGTSEAPRTATLERVWLDDARPRAGRQVPLKVLFRTYRGEEVVRTVPIRLVASRRILPETSTGRPTMMATACIAARFSCSAS